jgi:hypothetical protein
MKAKIIAMINDGVDFDVIADAVGVDIEYVLDVADAL